MVWPCSSRVLVSRRLFSSKVKSSLLPLPKWRRPTPMLPFSATMSKNCYFSGLCCAMPIIYLFFPPSPAVLRRRARLYPFGDSVYVRFLPNSLRSNNVRKLQSLRVPSGALMGLNGRGKHKLYSTIKLNFNCGVLPITI